MSKEEFVVGTLTAAPGTKVSGYLDVPGTTVRMPLTIVNGVKPGPSVLITGGVHGGEYPGIESAIRFAAELNPAKVSGRVTVIHIVSPLAFQARQQYVVPQDGKNVNRQFPGSALGTVTERMAHTIYANCMQGADAVIDLHGGDIHEALVPFTLYSNAAASAEVNAQSQKMAEVFGIKYLVPRPAVGGGTYGQAAAMNIPGMLAEAGQVGQLDEECVQIHLRGLRNVLKHLGVLPGTPDPVGPVTVLKEFPWLRAEQDGCWYPQVKIGDQVTAGQLVGVIKDYFGKVIGEYKAPATGVVLFSVTSLAIMTGDPILALGA